MSDLREWLKDASLTEIEAELQKRDKEHFDSLVKAESECLEETEQLSAKLTEANKLLEQTIEVLEGLIGDWTEAANISTRHAERQGNDPFWRGMWAAYSNAAVEAKPLLDNLKALKKEGTDG